MNVGFMENKKIELPYSIKISKWAYTQLAIVFVTLPSLLTIIGFFLNKDGGSNLFRFLLIIWPLFLGLFILIAGVMMVGSPKVILYSEYIAYKRSFFHKLRNIYFNEIEKIDKKIVMRYGARVAVPIFMLFIKLKNGEEIQLPVGNFNDQDVRFLIQVINKASSGIALNEWAEATREGKPRDYHYLWKGLKENWLTVIIVLTFITILRILLTSRFK